MFFNSLIKAIDRLIIQTVRLLASLEEVTNSITEVVDSNSSMKREIRKLSKLIALRTPGLVWLKVVREESEMLVFVLTLPPKSAPDVVSRELTVKVGDAEPQTLSPGVDDTESIELSGADNASVTGSLVDIDDAGNRSEARTFEFVLTDTIAPAQPAEVGVRVVREE